MSDDNKIANIVRINNEFLEDDPSLAETIDKELAAALAKEEDEKE